MARGLKFRIYKVWDQIFKGLVTMVQVRYGLEICCHG